MKGLLVHLSGIEADVQLIKYDGDKVLLNHSMRLLSLLVDVSYLMVELLSELFSHTTQRGADEIEQYLCHIATKACPDGTLPEIFLEEPTQPNDAPGSEAPGDAADSHDEL
jgi:hypothetical protein